MRSKNYASAAIGETIKAMRVKNQLTQEKLAELVDLGNAQQISDIERGMSGFSVAKLITFCEVLHVDADYLLFGTATRDSHNPINRYISHMTPEQARCVEELIAVYAKSCGIV